MVARPSFVAGFSPEERPRISVASDGSLAAIHEASRISVVEVPSCTAFAELGMDSNAVSCEVAWVGTPPRLLVLSRYEAHTTAHLVDPFGPRTIAEIRLETPMRLYAAVGSHALAVGAQGAAILAATDKNLTPYQFPMRTVPVAAGAAGNQFMVAMPGAIEEWDPQTRMPKRRLKLPRPAAITAVGGSDRVVWMTTQQEPSRIEVISLVNRGQPKAHDLPEPIASVSSHPRSDLIACIGATSGRVWVIDLDGRTGLRMVGPEGIDRSDAVGLVIGRLTGVLAAQAKRPITVVTLDRPDGGDEPARARTPSAPPADKRSSSLYDDDKHEVEAPTSVTLATPGVESPAPVTAAPPKPITRAPLPEFGARPPLAATPSVSVNAASPRAVPPRRDFGVSETEAPPAKAEGGAGLVRGSAATGPSEARDPGPPFAATERPKALAAWRDRIESPRARTAEPISTLWPDASSTWREVVIAWSRAIVAGEPADLPPGSPIEAVVARMDLPVHLEPVLAFAYAQHLQGHDGISAMDIATVQHFASWDEALGRGELVARGVATFRASRIRLADVVLRTLDEHPPRTGTVVGTPGIVSLLGPCVIVSAGPLPIIAEGCLASIGGAILAANSDADPAELAAEARPYGAAPMWRVRVDQLGRVPADKPFILVADDDATADLLGVPRLT